MARRSQIWQSCLLCLRASGAGRFLAATLSPGPAHWNADLGEYILNWDDIRTGPDPRSSALEFARAAFRHACVVCDWDSALEASIDGRPPPVI